MVHAMHYELDSTIPQMRELESVDYSNAGVVPSGSDPFTKQDPIDAESGFWHYTFYETRRLAALALRRFGATPKGYPAIGFLEKDKTDPVGPAARREALPKIGPGLTPRAVYDILGSPDYVLFGFWRYDIDCVQTYSLLLTWSDDGTVSKTEKVTPAIWKGELHRSIDGKSINDDENEMGPSGQLWLWAAFGLAAAVIALCIGMAFSRSASKDWVGSVT